MNSENSNIFRTVVKLDSETDKMIVSWTIRDYLVHNSYVVLKKVAKVYVLYFVFWLFKYAVSQALLLEYSVW